MRRDGMHLHLQDILANRRLITLLQPVLDLAEGRMAGYEALSRGPSASPLHAPQAMSLAAQAHGLLAALDWARMRAAFATFGRLRLAGRLFVNLSPTSLSAPAFAPETILAAMADAGIGGRQLVLELAAPPDCADLGQAVSRLLAAGIEIATDDPGTGFSRHGPWSELKPAFVRIDRDCFAGLHRDPRKAGLVRSIGRLAEDAHACVIAEGVESQADLIALKDLGVRYAQGYLIGRPSPVPVRRLPGDVAACLRPGRAAPSWRWQPGSRAWSFMPQAHACPGDGASEADRA